MYVLWERMLLNHKFNVYSFLLQITFNQGRSQGFRFLAYSYGYKQSEWGCDGSGVVIFHNLMNYDTHFMLWRDLLYMNFSLWVSMGMSTLTLWFMPSHAS